MKTKAIIKQFFTNHFGMIFSLAIILFLDLTFAIACPVLIKYIVGDMETIEVLTNEYARSKLQATSDAIMDSQILLVVLVCALGVSIIGTILFNILKQKKVVQFGNALTIELKKNAYSSLIHSDLSDIERFDKFDLENRIIYDTERIGTQYYGNHLINLIYSFAFSLASLILMFVFNATMGLVCLLCAPTLYLVVNYIDKAYAKKQEKLEANLKNQNDLLRYSINNLKLVKIRNGLEKEESKYNCLAKNIQRNYSSSKTFDALSKTGVYVALFIASFFIALGLLTYEFCMEDGFSIYEGIANVYALGLYFYGLRNCLTIFFDKQNIDVTFESLNKILELKLENRSENISSFDEIYSLRFSNVSYFSETQKNVEISNVDFELKKGERLAILGVANSGKSLITDLTAKLIRPTSGSITINNCDLLKVNTYYLRNVITYIPNNFSLIDTTVEGNIIYPLSLDEYRYNEALNKCFIKDMLMNLPNRDKENVLVAKLSESDKQKIALANAIYKDSPIIVLDDATTRLDANTENKIIDEFLKLKNKIEIISTMQIGIASKCDKVLLVSSGKVLEYGRTDELLANRNSVFYKMLNNNAASR